MRYLTREELLFKAILDSLCPCTTTRCLHNRKECCINPLCYTLCDDGKVEWKLCKRGIADTIKRTKTKDFPVVIGWKER